ncbi:MAG: energy transducer TonB [Fibrobacterota bacterium]
MKAFLYKFFLALFLTLFFVFSIPIVEMMKNGTAGGEKKYTVREVRQRAPERKKEKPKEKKIIKKNISLKKRSSADRGPGRFSLDLSVQGSASGAVYENSDVSDGVFESWEVDVPPVPSRERPPEFPSAAEEKQIEGLVELSFVIDEQGETGGINILREEPEGYGFGSAAVSAVSSWKYSPASREGIPVSIQVKRVIEFRY